MSWDSNHFQFGPVSRHQRLEPSQPPDLVRSRPVEKRLVAYSCKGRSLCLSCVARRMADTAAHLVDHVMPVAPYRLWTLSLPRSIRVRVVREPSLLAELVATLQADDGAGDV